MTALLIGLFAALLQFTIPQHTGAPAAPPGPSTYTFVAYTYVADIGGSSQSSITSPALTLSSGDFVYVSCRSAGTPSAITVTSSPANTFTALTGVSWQSAASFYQASYALSAGSGSTTFTCTPSVSETYQSMVVLQYHHSGASATFDTSAAGQATSNVTSITSPSFSTTSSDLVIFCASAGSLNETWGAGSIDGNTGTIRGYSNSSNSSNTDAGCEDTTFSSTQSSITATMTYNTSAQVAYAAAAFK